MSILIPGVSPPANCGECDHPTCTLWHGYDANQRHKDCPIIELPPHGRMGDLDALFLAMFQCSDGSIIGDKGIDGLPYEATYAEIKRFIRQAPTIVPAEGGDADERARTF